ncbi:MAG: hypothetical protein ACRBN8_06955 [Nannocystales bacterium]
MTPSIVLLARLLAPGHPAEVEVEVEEAPLRWVADDPSCPAAAEVREAVVELAGRWPDRDELQVEAFLQPREARWGLSLTMVLGDKVHRQEMEAESCAALARAAALIVAVSIDPVSSASVARVPLADEAIKPASAEAAEPDRDPGATAAETEVGAAPAEPRFVPFVGAGWGVVTGMTPTVSSGPTLAVGLSLDHSRFEITGRYVLPQSSSRGDGAAAVAQAGVVAARACLTSRPGVVRGLLCSGVEVGALRASGDRVSNARTQHFPWSAGLVRGGVRWRFAPRWALAADVEGSVSFVDAQVVTGRPDDPDAMLFETPRIGARGVLGVEFSIFRPRS